MENTVANLFDFGSKELTQDAILRWIFESYKDESVKPVVNVLLKEFEVGITAEEIKELHTYSQVKDIDISVVITSNSGKIYVIFIEDKTNSGVHDNQLMRYNDRIFEVKKLKEEKYTNDVFDFFASRGYEEEFEGLKEKAYNDTGKRIPIDSDGLKIIRIFYKSDYLTLADEEFCEEAVWKPFNIEKILGFFENIKMGNLHIVRQYYEHLRWMKKLLDSNVLPVQYMDKNNISKKAISLNNERMLWFAYLKNVLAPKLSKELANIDKGKEYRINVYMWTGRDDIGLQIFTHEYDLAYLVIKAKDLKDDKMWARIQIYGNDDAHDKNLWYKNNAKKVKSFMDKIEHEHNDDSDKNPLSCKNSKGKIEYNGSAKTIGKGNKINIDKKCYEDNIVDYIKKCYRQLKCVNDQLRGTADMLKREPLYIYEKNDKGNYEPTKKINNPVVNSYKYES